MNLSNMEGKFSSTTLQPQESKKFAKRCLIPLALSDSETYGKNSKMFPRSTCKDNFKTKKLKTSLTLTELMKERKAITDGLVLPSTVKLKKHKVIRLKSQDDLWKSIKSNYLYLMDNNLINECQKARKELSLFSTPSSPITATTQQPISFPEFIERFNDLHDRLHQLLVSLEDKSGKNDFIALQSEMDILGVEYTFLCDQASILQRLDTELKDDVNRRCTILKNKWDILLSEMWPKKKQEIEHQSKSLTVEVRNIRKWLREVEEKLRRLKVTENLSPEELKNIYNKEKVLQREIEERGREINSLVRRCQSATDGATSTRHPARLCRYALHLERSWHHIWIRSLENQCLTEQHLLRHSAVTTQNSKESSDTDSDEGPIRKHRRFALDHWTAVAATMDRMLKEQATRTGDIVKSSVNAQRTRDVGVLCGEKVSVNDKCIMVGTTGIAALKAEYGDDFTNFEIIQDVGYSSESSTHLSGDDTGLDHHFNVRIYQYDKDNQPLSLREELESACLRDFHCLGSSLESSSSAAASLDDSGLGTGETLTTGDSGDVLGQFRLDDEYEPEDLEYLETVLDECGNFATNASSDPEELHFNLSGLDSDDSSDNFHNRSSFTTSAQMFYKMISVDSDNGEAENNSNDSNSNIPSTSITHHQQSEKTENSSKLNNNNDADASSPVEDKTSKYLTSDSDPETFKPTQHHCHYNANVEETGRSHHALCSTPIRTPSDKTSKSLKRKRGYEDIDATRMSNRVRSWLKRCDDFSTSFRPCKPASRTSPDLAQSLFVEDVSSCDASCEYTSSSADEGNIYSSRSSFCDDEVFRLKSRLDSADGSVETVVHALLDSEYPFLLPPPPSSTASCASDSKNCSTICCRVKKRGRRVKASSDGDIEKLKSLKEISNLSSHRTLQNQGLSKTAAPGHRLYRSLPSVLRPVSDSSTDDNCIQSTLQSQSDTRTIGHTIHSSSSEFGRRRKRRSRKKSSSSNRSTASALLSGGDHSRHRSRTTTSSTSRCGSRRRNLSQRSEFFCPDVPSSDEGKSPLKVDIPPVEENVGFDSLRRDSAALLSPVESDIVLTHLEEQSTVSDQVWDGYQEMPYLSEGYSEATVDEDAVRKLTEFGDDYTSAIGQPIRLLGPQDGNNNKTECLKSQKKSPKVIPVNQRLSSLSADSDSDSEDLHYVIEEAGKALHFARAILKRRQAGDSLTSADYAELLATCGTHLRCLETIRKHIDGKEHNFSASDLEQLHYLIEEWEDLQGKTEMFEKSDDPAQQKYLKAQANIDALFNKMSQLSSSSELDISALASWEDVDKHMSRLQMVLTSLQEAKEQLLSVNLQVHRFTTEYSEDENYKDCSLKDEITELYRRWEDTYEMNGAQLTELENLKTDWEVYNVKYRTLRLRVKEAELENDCDSTRLISTATDSGSFKKDLEELMLLSASLETRLKGGDAWKKIEEEMKDLQRRIYRKDVAPKRTTSRSVNHRGPSSRVEEDADDNFEDAIQQMCEDKDDSSLSIPLKKNVATGMSPKRKRGRFWRIVRVAVPVQMALVLLYCLACYLEPSCCNSLNNFNFSFTPQLRYFGGRPPV